MIKSIVGSKFINVVSGYISYPYINMAQDKPLVGSLRYNSSSSNTEIFDGATWQSVPSTTPMVSIVPEAERALEWCINKMREEQELEKLAETDPTIKDLYDQLKQKQDQIKMVQQLKKKELNETGQSN